MARKNTHATVRLKPTEKDLYQSLAEELDMTLSEWIRRACADKAKYTSYSKDTLVYQKDSFTDRMKTGAYYRD